MHHQDTHPSENKPGLIAGIAGLARNSVGLLVARLELAALELSEVRTSLLKILLLGGLGLVAAWFAIAYWSLVLVVLAWPSLGWIVLLLLAGLFTIVAIALAFAVRSMLRQGKLSMPATMNELRSDRDNLL